MKEEFSGKENTYLMEAVFFKKYLFIYIFIWLLWVLVVACGI